MSLFVDRKFVSLISVKLERFTQKNDYLWNFRCPICGDSKKNKLKTRGYFYKKKSNLSFMCHNCHSSMSFGNFLKTMDKLLYKEYQLERYREENNNDVKQPDFSLAKKRPEFKNITIDLPTIQSLNDDHIAKKYCTNRKIPNLDELYYAEDFGKFVCVTFGSSDKKFPENDQRIVIPFYNEKNILLGVQGRAIFNSKVRYITQKISESNPKVFGLNKVDFTKPIYVVEGPIDSMFLKNSIASMDAALYNIVNLIGKHDFVFVYDNEKRNRNILNCMKKTIELGQKICIWPSNIKEKDVNDMILAGYNVQEIVDKNTFSDARAMLELEMWRKC